MRLHILSATAPGEYLRDELTERGIGIAEVAEYTRLCPAYLEHLLAGAVPLYASVAVVLGEFLGTSADLWMNLERAYAQRETTWHR